MSDKFSGISAMVRAALWFEDQLNLTVLNIGRESFARKDSCTLQCCGTHLLHSIQIDGGWVSLEVTPMDQAEQPQKLLTIGDTKQGWSDLCQLVQALEPTRSRMSGNVHWGLAHRETGIPGSLETKHYVSSNWPGHQPMTQASQPDRALPLVSTGTGTGYCQGLLQQRRDIDEIEGRLKGSEEDLPKRSV